jgi:Leucine Rich repeat
LESNGFGDEGALAMALAVRENDVLTKLDMTNNIIGFIGAVALAKALHVNTCLRVLRLGENSIGDFGALAFAGALRSNSTMPSLDLHRNGISDKGVAMIIKALKEDNCVLSSLNLKDNAPLSLDAEKSIDFVLASRLVLSSWFGHLRRPLEKRLIPLVIQVQLNYSCHQETELFRNQATSAGPIFHLVRALVSIDSKEIEPSLSRKRSRLL